jgi:hypothetical protein
MSSSSDWKALIVPAGALARGEAVSAERCACGAVRTPLSESCPQCHSLAAAPGSPHHGAAAAPSRLAADRDTSAHPMSVTDSGPSVRLTPRQAARTAPGMPHRASADAARPESSGHDFARLPVNPGLTNTIPRAHAESAAVPQPALLQGPPSLTPGLARPDPAFRQELAAFVEHGLAPPPSGGRWQIQSIEGPQSLSAADPDLAPGRGVVYRVHLTGSGDRAMHVAVNYDPVAHRFGRVSVLGSSGHGGP